MDKKYLSLAVLMVQNALLGLSMRYARTREGDMFFEATAVLMGEVVKLFACLCAVYRYEGGQDVQNVISALHNVIVVNWLDTLKVCVPSFIYLVQNNLLYVAAEHLEVATYQVTYQLKILTTAMFTVVMLQRPLLKTQWIALLTLMAGVACVQLSDSKESRVVTNQQNRLLGFGAALTACILSGLAGVYFEKILKGSDISVWMRNIQLSLLSLPLGVAVVFARHYDGIMEKGFFFGYDLFVVYLVLLNALGGLVVASVVKYADNILKGFACSMAIVLTCFISVPLFGFQITFQFSVGVVSVILSIFLYGSKPEPSKKAMV